MEFKAESCRRHVKGSQRPVSRILFPAFRRGDNHSSSNAIAGGIQRPTRRLRTGRPVEPPYLALLRAGICLPPMLPPARCALTATFHPYPLADASGRYVVCATFLQVALTGRYPAHCPAEFGLSSPPSRLPALRRGDHLAHCAGN